MMSMTLAQSLANGKDIHLGYLRIPIKEVRNHFLSPRLGHGDVV